jgi:hypothetical protein
MWMVTNLQNTDIYNNKDSFELNVGEPVDHWTAADKIRQFACVSSIGNALNQSSGSIGQPILQNSQKKSFLFVSILNELKCFVFNNLSMSASVTSNKFPATAGHLACKYD